MRRFLFLAFILLVFAGIFFLAPERQAPSAENPYFTLHRIMQLSGATVTEGEFHYWAPLGRCPQINSLSDLETKADDLLRLVACNPSGENSGSANSLQIEKHEQPIKIEKGISHALYRPEGSAMTEEPSYMMAERFTDLQSGAKMRLLLQRMEQEGESIVHLLITVNQEGEAWPLGGMAYRLFSMLEPQTEGGNLSFCLTGHLQGELDSEEMQELALLVTHGIGGEQVQSISDGKMISVTGYTPDLGDYFKAENLRINLNLAMRYDEHLDKTVIWAGTPLISRYY